MIQVQGLSHQFGSSPVLRDLDFDLPQGGITALIGPNGAGKSTLLNLLARQMSVQTGRILLDGRPLGDWQQRALAQQLAFVPQSNLITARLSVEDLVHFGRWPHSRGRLSPNDHQAIENALQQFDLLDLRHRFLDELSGGQRQRAQVALAYAQDTDWLLLDEPLNNLDTAHARRLMQLLHSISRPDVERPRTILIVVHEVNYAAAWADQVLALKSGELAFFGPSKELLTGPNLAGLYESAIQVVNQGGQTFVQHYV